MGTSAGGTGYKQIHLRLAGSVGSDCIRVGKAPNRGVRVSEMGVWATELGGPAMHEARGKVGAERYVSSPAENSFGLVFAPASPSRF